MRGERFLFHFYLGFFLSSSRWSRGDGHRIIPVGAATCEKQAAIFF